MWRFVEIRSIGDIPRYWARETPEKTALIEGDVRRSYRELDRRSNRIANRLLSMGVKPGDMVGYIGKNSIEVWEIWFAASKMGCGFAAFNWRLAVPEIVQIVKDAAAPVIFVTAEMAGVMEKVRAEVGFETVSFNPCTAKDDPGLDAWIAGVPADDPNVEVSPDDIALLCYSSGTTGTPKGIETSQRAFQYWFLESTLEPSLNRRADDILLMSMPNFHVGGSSVSIPSLYHGGTIAILPFFDPDALIAILRRDRPTIIPLVPTAMHLLVSRPDLTSDDFESVRLMFYFGSPIGKELLRSALEKFRCEFCQGYGTTESHPTAILPHEDHLDPDAPRLGSCGRLLPMCQMIVVDDEGNEVEPGVVGELVAYTPTMMTGYRNLPDQTAQVLKDGWYRTGDLARRDCDGFFYIVDRKKDMIISGGENVYSAEVELALLKHPDVAVAAVIGTPDEKWGQKVTALIVPRPGAEPTEEAIQSHCRDRLAGYKVPKTVIFETALPMTPSGKVQKALLRKRFTPA